MKIHVVQAGESVWSIASDYGVDPDRLAADNEVPPSGALAVGQTLGGPVSAAGACCAFPGETPDLHCRRIRYQRPDPLAQKLAVGRF